MKFTNRLSFTRLLALSLYLGSFATPLHAVIHGQGDEVVFSEAMTSLMAVNTELLYKIFYENMLTYGSEYKSEGCIGVVKKMEENIRNAQLESKKEWMMPSVIALGASAAFNYALGLKRFADNSPKSLYVRREMRGQSVIQVAQDAIKMLMIARELYLSLPEDDLLFETLRVDGRLYIGDSIIIRIDQLMEETFRESLGHRLDCACEASKSQDSE